MWSVYVIEFDDTRYAGISNDVVRRWGTHLLALANNRHSNQLLQASAEGLNRVVLYIDSEHEEKSDATRRERELHNSGYLGAAGLSNRKPVIDNLGNVYQSATDAAKALEVSPNRIQDLLSPTSRHKHVKGRFFEYYTGQAKARDPIPSSFLVYCSNGEVYDSVLAAGRILGLNPDRIRSVVDGKSKHTGNLVFARDRDTLTQRIADLPPPNYRANARRVKNSDGTEFDSLSEAARFVDGDPETIKMCCSNPKRRHKGYHWSFIE